MFAQVDGRSDGCVTLDQELFRFVVSTSVLSRINMDIETPTSSKEIAKVVSRLLSRLLRMASGKVWVCPIMLPANMIVAPNSDIARAQAKAAPPAIAGHASGMVILQKVDHGETPRVSEISSSSFGTEANPIFAARI